VHDVLLDGASAGRIANVLRQDSLYPHADFLIPFFANHDTPRLASATNATLEKLKLAFGLTLTIRGIPEIYYGDEIAMKGAGDPDNRRDFPGGWPDDERNAFTRAGRTPEQQEIFAYVQKLLALRREHDALREGKLWHLAAGDSIYIFLRESDAEKLLVAFHNGASLESVDLSVQGTPAEGAAGVTSIFGNGQAVLSGRQLKLSLPPQSFSIFALE